MEHRANEQTEKKSVSVWMNDTVSFNWDVIDCQPVLPSYSIRVDGDWLSWYNLKVKLL